ncbi:MAG: DNA topoisomerase [Deltaproteobacteria bacterium]|nr:DNA topoisomerase [Deltaproteobacteria bacterium]
MSSIETVALDEATRYRYLNYAMSVITSRALPDVRDGLKPVQRRILYAMFNNLHLRPDGRYRKSAAVVGEVMAKYHPHGDSSIYEAMVRMAQPFSLLHTLVDGQGNFGSMDGDSAAAMRYTEAKLTPIAMELLTELKQKTVDYQPTYDGQLFEPLVLPAQFPNLLLNGSEGIAVGMATKIPPHNLRELIDACLKIIENPLIDIKSLCKKIKGPDFPTGGLILNAKDEILNIYETGSGPVKLRGTWHLEKEGRKGYVIIDEIPYAVNKSTLIEKIGSLILNKKIPQLEDVRDESTDQVRIVLTLKIKQGSSADLTMQRAMAYLCKNTQLQLNFNVNLTCLIPDSKSGQARPVKANLKKILDEWLKFRFKSMKRRIQHDLNIINERLHLLEGFSKAFEILDILIELIRKSDNKKDAHSRIKSTFEFTDTQIDSILELRLYKLAKLEIYAIEEEMKEKKEQASAFQFLLDNPQALWSELSKELLEIRKLYGTKRKTSIGGIEEELTIADDSAYILDEKTYVVVTKDGWIKRLGRVSNIEKIRTREGDFIASVTKTNTKCTFGFFSNQGTAYVMRVADIPSTSGYGDPIQKYFTFANGEKIVSAMSFDPRCLPPPQENDEDKSAPSPYGVAITYKGRIIRFSLSYHSTPSNKTGRKYMKPDGADDYIAHVMPASGDNWVCMTTQKTRALAFSVSEITLVRGAGKGITSAKLDKDDRLHAFTVTGSRKEGLVVESSRGRDFKITPKLHEGKRASRGTVLLKRDALKEWTPPLFRYDEMYNHEESSQDSTEESSEENTPIEGPDGLLLFRFMDE